MEFEIIRGFDERDDELIHYGIPHMEWYKRRWQDKFGRLTAEGRERYRKMAAERRAETHTSDSGTEHSGSGGKFGGSAGAEDEESKKKKKQINSKTTELFKAIESIEKKWESGEYFDKEKAGPVAFNKDDQLSARSLEDNIQRILDGKWDGYQDPDMKKAVQLVKELQELGGDPKSFISAYKTAYKKDSSKNKSDDGDQRPYRKEYNPSLTGTEESALASKWKGSSAKTYDDGNIGNAIKDATKKAQITKLSSMSDEAKKKSNSVAAKNRGDENKGSEDKINTGDQRPYRKEYNPSLTGTEESALASKWKKGSSAKTYDDGSARLVRREIQPTKLNEMSDKDKEKIKAAARKVYFRKNSSGTNK